MLSKWYAHAPAGKKKLPLCRRLFKMVLFWIFFGGAIAFSNDLLAQIQITGTVTHQKSLPLPAVTVFVQGSNKTTTTDDLGHYSIDVPSSKSVLVFTLVGYAKQSVKVDSKKNINVDLIRSEDSLGDVIVTAMGVRRAERNIGYSVQSVSGVELVKARDPNVIGELAGKVAGLSIGASAEMLGRPSVVLRGNSDLLYVVDGVPVSSDTWNINADDIESFSVLKGPNAAALYGSRGQNGAIIITTKRASRKGGSGWRISFNTSDELEKGFIAVPLPQTEYGRGGSPSYDYEFAKGYTYGTTGTDVQYDNAQRLPVWGPRFEGQQIKQYDSKFDASTGVRGTSAWLARGKNNLKNFIEPGFLSTNNISAEMGGDNFDLRMSYSHMLQKGMDPNTRLNMDILNLSGGIQFTPKLSAEASINLNEQYTPNIPDSYYGPNSYVYEFSVYGSADYDVRDLKNYYGGNGGVTDLMQNSPEYGRMNNPYFQAAKWTRGHYKTDIIGYIKLNYKFSEDLNLSLRSQITTWNMLRTENVPASGNLNTYLSWYTFGSYNGDFREDRRILTENNTDALLSYRKTLKNGLSLNALAGGSWRSFKYTSEYATTQNLTFPNVYTLQNSKGTPYLYDFNSNMMVYSGYYSLDLGYKRYVSLSTTGRVDHLSTFASGYNVFFYPSVSISSAISDYVKLPSFISYLKLRASYADVKGGLTQSTAGSAYYMNNNGTTLNSGLLGYGSELYTSYDGPSYKNQSGLSSATYYNGTPSVNSSSTIANSKLKPADNKSYEGGVDVNFFHDRLNLNVTYFESLAGPQIYSLAVAASTGYDSRNVNGVTTKKTGLEISVNATPIKNPNGLTWSMNFNYSTYKEVLKSIYGGESSLLINSHYYKVGERMDAYYGAGLVRTTAGKIVYSGGVPIANPSSSVTDETFLGNMNPDFTFGFSNHLSYKSWSLNFQIDGRIGGKIYDYVYAQMLNGGNAKETVTGKMGTARLAEWNSTNSSSQAPSASYLGDGVVVASGTPVYSKGIITNTSDLTFTQNATPALLRSYISALYNTQEYFMISRSFAKLREVSLTYSVPQTILKNTIFKSMSVSVVGRNLLYFAARKDFDIDQFASGYNFSDNSLNKGTILQSPTARRYGININLTF